MDTADATRVKSDQATAKEDMKQKAKKTNPYEFSDLSDTSSSQPPGNIDFILDIPLEITVELGRTKMLINDLLKLGQGSVIELSKLAGETLEVLANQRLIARGEVVVMNEKYGIRLTEIVSPAERIERLR
ncbi:MAG: flagellar motor switch protein FliN [Deltaproteobacteria bacterium]|nr:flagellar motor switch protein FliN [Deltaproteobacteria bacterium]HDM09880.1 flagellar motor switch protein FliN [Desulfobacteraceae bacterium]